MYKLPYYTEKDDEAVIKFMHDHPFVTLCGTDASGKIVATQIPLLIGENPGGLRLRGHIMKNTDHHRAFAANPDVLVLFQGPHTYVSASWYTNPRQGSTWNYMTVQARGTLRFLDETALLETLRETTAHFENDAASPASFEQLPDEYINRLIKAIVAIEISVYHLDNVFKLSQNRDRESYRSIIKQLNMLDGQAKKIAGEMQEREKTLFE